MNQYIHFDAFQDLKSLKNFQYSLFFWLEAPVLTVLAWRRCKDILTKVWLNQLINYSVTEVFVEQPLASPGSAEHIVTQNIPFLPRRIWPISLHCKFIPSGHNSVQNCPNLPHVLLYCILKTKHCTLWASKSQTWKKPLLCELWNFGNTDLAEKTRKLQQILDCDNTA